MTGAVRLYLDERGSLYVGGKLLCNIASGELVRLESKTGGYSIIIHRKPEKRQAKIIKLADRVGEVTP